MINIASTIELPVVEGTNHAITFNVKTHIPHKLLAFKPVLDSDKLEYVLLVERIDKPEWIVWYYGTEDEYVHTGEYCGLFAEAYEIFCDRGRQ